MNKALLALMKATDDKLTAFAQQVADRIAVNQTEVKAWVLTQIKEALAELPEPKQGEPGQDGRDALALEVLPAIDEAKSYPRGTWATHKGGLWRAYEATHGQKGWECMVKGVAGVSFDMAGRDLTAVIQLSDGTEAKHLASFPVVLDKGVFKPGSDYQEGDAVTWGGSLWIATQAAPEGRPGASNAKGWRLAVKKGRDGKDGKNGIDKAPVVKP